MTQTELERAVARATGESVSFIRRRGFGPLVLGAVKRRTRKAARLCARLLRKPEPTQPPSDHDTQQAA
jgi:hypothetical protein